MRGSLRLQTGAVFRVSRSADEVGGGLRLTLVIGPPGLGVVMCRRKANGTKREHPVASQDGVLTKRGERSLPARHARAASEVGSACQKSRPGARTVTTASCEAPPPAWRHRAYGGGPTQLGAPCVCGPQGVLAAAPEEEEERGCAQPTSQHDLLYVSLADTGRWKTREGGPCLCSVASLVRVPRCLDPR